VPGSGAGVAGAVRFGEMLSLADVGQPVGEPLWTEGMPTLCAAVQASASLRVLKLRGSKGRSQAELDKPSFGAAGPPMLWQRCC